MTRPVTLLRAIRPVLGMFLLLLGTAPAAWANTSDLSFLLDVVPNPVQAGQPVSFTIGAMNHGPDSTTNVTVDGGIPPGFEFCSFVVPLRNPESIFPRFRFALPSGVAL